MDHRQRLALCLLPRRELAHIHLEPFALDAQPRQFGARGGDPDIRMWSVSNLRAHHEALQFRTQQLKHRLPRDEGRRSEGNGQLVPRAVVVATHLRRATGNAQPVERRDTRRGEVVQRGVDVSAVEARCTGGLVLRADDSLVESAVRRMLELRLRQALVVIDDAVPDKLHLRHPRVVLRSGCKMDFLFPPSCRFRGRSSRMWDQRFSLKRTVARGSVSHFETTAHRAAGAVSKGEECDVPLPRTLYKAARIFSNCSLVRFPGSTPVTSRPN